MALTIAAVLMAMVPAQALAATPYQTWDYTNPQTTGCANIAWAPKSLEIKNSKQVTVGKIELRYSTSCFTAWARVQNLTGGPSYVGTGIYRDNVNVPSAPPAYSEPLNCSRFCIDYVPNKGWSYGYQIYDGGALRAYTVGFICYTDKYCEMSPTSPTLFSKATPEY